MIRTLLTAATVATFALTFAPARAMACGADEGGDCPCKHGKKEAAAGEKKAEAKTDKKAAPTAKTEEKKDAAQKPAEHTSVMEQVDQLLAAKCPCASQADCTCKKGECKCSKCSGHKKTVRMIESLRDDNDGAVKPVNARMDATAGVFI